MHTSIISLLIIAITITLGQGFCDDGGTKKLAPANLKGEAAGEDRSAMKIAEANNQFGFDLFKQLEGTSSRLAAPCATRRGQ